MLICNDLAKRSTVTIFYFQATFEFINDYFNHSLKDLLPKTNQTTLNNNSKTLNKQSVGCLNSAKNVNTNIRSLIKSSNSRTEIETNNIVNKNSLIMAPDFTVDNKRNPSLIQSHDKMQDKNNLKEYTVTDNFSTSFDPYVLGQARNNIYERTDPKKSLESKGNRKRKVIVEENSVSAVRKIS